MPTPNTIRGVFQMYDACPYCHKPLKHKDVTIFGKTYDVTCFGSCGCEDAMRVVKTDRVYEPTDHLCPKCRLPMQLDISSGYVSACPECGYETVFRSDLESYNTMARMGSDMAETVLEAGITPRYLQHEVDLEGVQNEVYDGKSLYVFGPNGTGKSTFAANLAKALVYMGRKVLFRNSKLLTEEIKKTFDGVNTDILDRCFSAEVLFIDDLGKEQPTEYALSMLYAVIEARYSNMLPIVVTSNYSRGQLVSRWAGVDESTARAIASRLCDGVRKVEMTGRDWRAA